MFVLNQYCVMHLMCLLSYNYALHRESRMEKKHEIYMTSLLKPVYLLLKDCRPNPYQPETINNFPKTEAEC